MFNPFEKYGWNTYRNKELDFGFMYRDDWELAKTGINYDKPIISLVGEGIEENISIYYYPSVADEIENQSNQLGATTLDELIEKSILIKEIGKTSIGGVQAKDVILGGNSEYYTILTTFNSHLYKIIFSHIDSKDKLTEKERQIISQFVFLGDSSEYCFAPPIPRDIGDFSYPVNKEKYGGLSFLGAIFTANDCGIERLNEFYVNGLDNQYNLGSNIWLDTYPSKSLVTIFKDVGFSCSDVNFKDAQCREWQLLDSVKIKDLLKLQPYYEYFRADDCRNCG